MSVFEEGAYREWVITKGAGKQDVQPKDDLRKMLGRSCDLFDAFVVAVELARRDGFQIGTTDSKGTKPNGFKWLKTMQEDHRKLLHKEVLA